jgi:hypothetical protein
LILRRGKRQKIEEIHLESPSIDNSHAQYHQPKINKYIKKIDGCMILGSLAHKKHKSLSRDA